MICGFASLISTLAMKLVSALHLVPEIYCFP
jgi:hypothetical protein